ncbi:GAF and ANTAR domain-containing protein [Micromonospora foliorum]|uniref:GAF and ANTAR domain-containing protein n=1 Tax=Micromonospora foliorum TaxID=2911210 RepID=UPI001EE95688|nr:GAF and ANTAR domain-containing protein [Micromonospora foliorum]MCG5438114.1 GAF and ANTAR domain-containing protein [Micromonospora foliorum]
MTDAIPMLPVVAFAELGRIKFNETDFSGVLSRVTGVAARTVPGADEVSVTLVGAGGAHTAAFTGALALTVDEAQYTQGDGPCLLAAAATSTVHVPDMAAESRWPTWARQALTAGVGCSLSIGLPMHEYVSGALNIYANRPDAFDDKAVTLAETFAEYAAVAMTNAHLYDTQVTLAQHMQAAMRSRAVIEQAKGIIMGERRCTADEAFAILAKTSQESNRKLRDVAAALVARAASTAQP